MGLSEIMTILIWFHCSGYRNFKTYYREHVRAQWRAEFPGLVSYSRFVEFMPSAPLPLCAYLRTCFEACTGISFLDSTPLVVCDKHRIHQHKVFADLAQRGKSSIGLQLITKLKSNMKNRLLPLADKMLLRKRAMAETIIDQLKNISQIEHTRHRSVTNFMEHCLRLGASVLLARQS